MPMFRSMIETRSGGTSPRDLWGEGADLALAGGQVAGVTVTQESGARLATAFSCIRLLSESCGSLPWATYRRVGGERQPANRPIWLDRPNPELTRMEFVEQLIASLQVDGNAFALIVRDEFGFPLEFWPLDPRSVVVQRDANTRELIYFVDGRRLTAWDVLHVSGFRLPGKLRGLSPIEWCKATFGVAQATEDYAANFFANGANPGSVIELADDPGEAAIRAMAQRWRRAHGGVKKSHLPGILTHGAQWKPVSIPNDQAQFLETRKFSRSEIAGIFRCPPHMVGDLEKATFSNIEHQGIDFVRYSLNPWLERLELRFNMLLPRGEFVKFNPDKLLRGDTRNRYAAHASALQNGWLNVNEVRRMEDLPGIGQAGDEYRPMAPVGPSTGGGGGDPLNNNGGEPKDEE